MNLTALMLLIAAEPAMATASKVSTPDLSLQTVADLVSWVTGKPAPHWGSLPRQASGTAAGRGHSVPADATRALGGAGHVRKPGKGELAAFQPAGRKVTKGLSAVGTTGFVARTSKRVASKSTATSDYFQNADGSFTRRLAQGPVNYRDPSGNWQAIQTGIAVGSDRRWHEKANSLAVDFAPSAADPALARIGLGAGQVLAYGLTGAAPV
ncbi:MAG TPA: hypothetical protein VNW94_18795, partial [Streptosporangiaceae bacterium]|nr:hypothetical protein [Streptosporangiaceae bacterium]